MCTCKINEKKPKLKEFLLAKGEVVGTIVCELTLECQLPSLTSDPEGFCILHSRQPNKDLDTFEAALKAKLAREEYDFSMVFFPGAVDFSYYEFKSRANFLGAIFLGRANFSSAVFSEGTSFSWSKFSAEADFTFANFSIDVNFSNAIFSRDVFFHMTQFSSMANFSGATFSADSIAKFCSINSTDSFGHKEPLYADFSCLRLDSQAQVSFENLSLDRVELAGTDLRRLGFKNVTWARRWGRNVVYDEILLTQAEKARESQKEPERPTRERYARVEELYRQLKLNYEAQGDLKNAGDFHYGEMEMHRKASPLRRWLSWYSFYWALSGYGERPLRALLYLLALIPGLALLVWGLGIEYDNLIAPAGFWDTLLFIIEKATLQRPTWLEPGTRLSQFFANLSVLLIPGQVALFLLALRNRLGRRR